MDLGKLDFRVLKDDTSFWANCKNCQETFKVCLYSCLLYLFRLVSAFRCLALKTRVYSSSFLSKHWKFRSSRPDKTSGSSGLAFCLWQWLTSDSGRSCCCRCSGMGDEGCSTHPTGTAPSSPAPPGQKTLWFHVVTSSLVLKHYEIVDMLLHKSLIAFINSACRIVAVSWPWPYQHSAVRNLQLFLFLLPWCAGVLGHGSLI